MPPYDAGRRLARQAARLDGAARSPLPALLALTDPDRTPGLPGLARALPPGSALIYRHFGAPDRFAIAADLARIAQARELVFLVSADAELARACGADGQHFPETRLDEARHARRRGDPGLFTAACHSRRALERAARAGIDAVLLSPILPSRSPSAVRPLGLMRAAAVVRTSTLPVYALGGINAQSGRRLGGFGFSGMAAIDGLTG